jgi:hypothetical protein
MHSIRVRQRVGADQMLHLDLPVEVRNQEVEVMVIYQPIAPEQESVPDLSQFYGCIQDETFIRQPQGEQPEREPLP